MPETGVRRSEPRSSSRCLHLRVQGSAQWKEPFGWALASRDGCAGSAKSGDEPRAQDKMDCARIFAPGIEHQGMPTLFPLTH